MVVCLFNIQHRSVAKSETQKGTGQEEGVRDQWGKGIKGLEESAGTDGDAAGSWDARTEGVQQENRKKA